jgi:hypothetical protein
MLASGGGRIQKLANSIAILLPRCLTRHIECRADVVPTGPLPLGDADETNPASFKRAQVRFEPAKLAEGIGFRSNANLDAACLSARRSAFG